jgi:hypothetical protein
MKKVNFTKVLSFLAIVLVSISCSKDESITYTNQDIIGTWTLNSVNYIAQLSATVGGLPITGSETGNAYSIDYDLTFSESPDEVVGVGTFGVNSTRSFYGQSTTTDTGVVDQSSDNAWVLADNKIAMTFQDIDFEFKIVKISNGVMTLKGVQTTTEIIDGYIVTSKYTMNMVLTQQ